jgi:hypothetical protein
MFVDLNKIVFAYCCLGETRQSDVQRAKKTNKKKTNRCPWSEEERKAVKTHFEKCIALRTVPGKNACEAARLAQPALANRDWPLIKWEVKNLITKSRP